MSVVHSYPVSVARFTGLPVLHGRGKTGGGQSLERGPMPCIHFHPTTDLPMEFQYVSNGIWSDKVLAPNLARGWKGSLDVSCVRTLVTSNRM